MRVYQSGFVQFNQHIIRHIFLEGADWFAAYDIRALFTELTGKECPIWVASSNVKWVYVLLSNSDIKKHQFMNIAGIFEMLNKYNKEDVGEFEKWLITECLPSLHKEKQQETMLVPSPPKPRKAEKKGKRGRKQIYRFVIEGIRVSELADELGVTVRSLYTSLRTTGILTDDRLPTPYYQNKGLVIPGRVESGAMEAIILPHAISKIRKILAL